MENKFVLAKNYNIQQAYQLNEYVDAKDTVNHWCVGQIVDFDEEKNQVKVHFEGWSPRYDEWMKKNSQRLGPFRRHTEGYTGQKKNAFRDFKMSLTYHKTMQQKVQDIIKGDFKLFETPMQLTQFVRGELYFYIDSLISLFNTTTQEDLLPLFEFMRDIFTMIFKWMDLFPQYLSSFQDSLHHPQLYLVSYEAAIAMCGNELFSILEKCFGRCVRCNRFFQKFSSEYLPTDGENNFASKDQVKSNAFMASFVNAFGNMGGFQKVLSFINFDIKDSKQFPSISFYYRDKLVKGCPFILTMKILRAFQSIFEVTDQTFSQKFAEDICFGLTYRLDTLSENEIKELDKDILRGIVDVLKEYMMIIQPQEADKAAELRELQIAQKYLRCPFFEKRVRGINELKEIVYKVQNASYKNKNSDQYAYTKWLNFDKYSQWIIDEKIIEFIFIENPHVELIKRSVDILKLLSLEEKYFSPEIVEMLWTCASEKHEDIVRATLDIVQDLALIMPLERLGQFAMKLKSLKENEFDEKLVVFLKNFTLNTMKNINKLRKSQSQGIMNTMLGKKKEVKIDESKFIDLLQFWSIFQDSNKVSQKIKDLALTSLIEILQEFNDKEMKDQYILLTIENIKNGNTFYSSLIFLRKLLNTYPLESQIKFKTTGNIISVKTILHEIFKKNNLFDMILQNLFDYLKGASLQMKQKGFTPNDKPQSLCLYGSATHEDFIDVVISFIEFVIINSQVALTFENIEKMFQLLVTKAVTEYESNALFNLITKENENAKSKERRFLLDDKVRNEVFQKIFCNNKYLNFEKINIQGFSCFKRLFLIVNQEEKSLEQQKEDRIVVNNLNQLQGIETLWAIAIQCENSQVKDICRDFLVDLYLKIKTKQSSAQKKQINEIFPQRCFAYLKNLIERPDHQLNCLKLIKTFISRFDGDHIVEEDMSQFPVNELKVINVTLNPDKANAQVRAHGSQKLWQVKRKMANAYKLRLSEFFIKTKGGPLEESVYDEQLKEYKIEALYINRVPMEEMEKEFPRYLIGYNSDYLTVFLDLLKSGKEDCKREVLSLLEILPINLDVKMFVREVIVSKIPQNEKQQNEWQKLFQWNKSGELSTTCYYLMTLEDLVIPKKDSPIQETNQQEQQTKQEFSTKLIQNGGFMFLYELFLSIDKKNLERDIIRSKSLNILMRVIPHLLTLKHLSTLKALVTPPLIESLIKETLSIIENYIKGVYKQQLNESALKDVRNLKNEVIILKNSMLFLNKALNLNQTLIESLYNYPEISTVFRIALIDLDINEIQLETAQMILDISLKFDMNSQLSLKPSYFFINIFFTEFLDYSLKVVQFEKTRNFFKLFNEVFMRTDAFKDLHLIKPVNQLSKEISHMIRVRDIREISARDEDVPLQGLFSLLKNIFIKFPEIRDSFEEKNDLLQYLIHDCLFHKETRGQLIQKAKAMPPKCKNNNTRDRCLDLLNELCINNPEGVYTLIRYLKNYISETFWRTPRRSDWSITVHQQERSLTGFVGLKNIGCICYMNSIMQQLFMIPTFRKAILEVEDSNFGKEPTDENVLHQLKMIFGGLMEIEKQYFNPKKFCSAFKDIDGSPIDPMVQKDVDEFFNMAMDRIENLVKGKKEDKVIKNLFQGVLANEFICKGCPHYSEREEPFMTINLQVKNKHSIKESLESFVEGEMLEGDNAYYCEKCEKKVNTLKRCCIKRMPNVLFMVLKRFEFNYDTMTKFKINDYCEFPMQINMKDYSQEALAKQDLLKEMEDKNLTMEDLSEEQRAILERDLPSKYYDYNLRGTVVHIGTAEQGHYISYIQDRENQPNKWYEFNDNLVKEFDPEDIPYEAYGGEDDTFVNNLNLSQLQGSGYNEQMLQAMKQLKTKIKNAYILIYERDETIDMEKFNEYMDDPNINTNKQDINFRFDQCKVAKTTSAQIQIPPTIHDFILEKNKKFWLSKFIFNKAYIESVLSIFTSISIEEDDNYLQARQIDLQSKSGSQLEIFKFLTTFFLTTAIRAKERKTVPQFMQIIREALNKNVSLSVWLLESFSNQDLIKEFLIDSPIPDMKRFVAGLLKTAMQKVYGYEEENIKVYLQQYDSGIVEYVQQTQGQLVKHHRTVDMKVPTTKGDIFYTGQCKNLDLITLNHHNEKLPILIVMINSFIHLNVSPHYFKNQRLSAQFYQVFSHFSQLGQQSRHYLLKNKTVGRMLDIFFNEISGNKTQPQISEKFRHTVLENIPLFQVEKELYMKSNLEKVDAKLSLSEKKAALNDATQPYMFLMYTVSVLSRSCQFVKDSAPNPLANDQLNFKLDDDELAMIIDHENNQIWEVCGHKVTRNAIADMYAHISFENKEFSLQFLSTVLNGLNKTTFDRMKIYERSLIKQIMIKDQYQIDRTKKALSGLQEIMKANTQYYKDMDSIHDIILKITQRSLIAVEIINKNQTFMRFIEQWCKENPHIPLNQQKTRIFKQGIVLWNNKPNQLNQQTTDKIALYQKDRLQKLQSLVSKETPTNENAYDSDDDLYHHKFQDKERLDYIDSSNYIHTGTVEFALDEMIRFVSEVTQINQKPIATWIGTENDNLSAPNTLISSDKKRMHIYYMGLLRTL